MLTDILEKLIEHGDNIIYLVLIILIWKNPDIIGRISSLIKHISDYKTARHKEIIELYKLKWANVEKIRHQRKRKKE